MDNILQTQMLTLLRGALTGETVTVDTPFDLPALTKEAQRHSVENMLFYGARAAGKQKNDPDMCALLKTVGRNIFITENQIAEAQAVCTALDAAGIDHLPLKGMVLRELYPSADMRTMGDVDILIRMEQYPQIEQIMTAQGFTFLKESGHELIWEKPGILHLELHKALFASYETDLYKVFGDGWKRALQVGNSHRYTLSDEGHFLYVFVHFAKHYRGGGVGLRHLSDVAVYLQSGRITDTAYIEQQLTALHMAEFYHNILDVLTAWLHGGEMTQKAMFILQQVWTSGRYGTADSHRIAAAERAAKGAPKNAKARHMWRLIFPPYSDMNLRYPLLKKAAVLLPVMWLVRWVDLALRRPQYALQKGKTVMAVSAEDVRDKQQALRYVGLQPMADRSHK